MSVFDRLTKKKRKTLSSGKRNLILRRGYRGEKKKKRRCFNPARHGEGIGGKRDYTMSAARRKRKKILKLWRERGNKPGKEVPRLREWAHVGKRGKKKAVFL